MKIYTFTYCPQWSFCFYQIVAKSEIDAAKMVGIANTMTTYPYQLVSTFPTKERKPRIVFSIEYENPTYEG